MRRDTELRHDLFPLRAPLPFLLDLLDSASGDEERRPDAVGLVSVDPGPGFENADVFEVGERTLDFLKAVKLVAVEELDAIDPDERGHIVFAENRHQGAAVMVGQFLSSKDFVAERS